MLNDISNFLKDRSNSYINSIVDHIIDCSNTDTETDIINITINMKDLLLHPENCTPDLIHSAFDVLQSTYFKDETNRYKVPLIVSVYADKAKDQIRFTITKTIYKLLKSITDQKTTLLYNE